MQTTMTKLQIWKKVNAQHSDFLFSLRERWSCEPDETKEEYLECIQKFIPEAFKMYKRPFGFDCQGVDGVVNISIKNKGKYLQLVAKDVK